MFTAVFPLEKGQQADAVIASVRVFILVILAFALCSCADFKGFHPKPAADDDRDDFGHVPGSGDPE